MLDQTGREWSVRGLPAGKRNPGKSRGHPDGFRGVKPAWGGRRPTAGGVWGGGAPLAKVTFDRFFPGLQNGPKWSKMANKGSKKLKKMQKNPKVGGMGLKAFKISCPGRHGGGYTDSSFIKGFDF